ncbi:ABC transporter substrate-binding protein [Motiliproteus sp. MSK22-1]|uniref:ABC transporter substrate-binding protein n=1 Tax=Motiliproteus sp. MSK22-1 TaxID=1897630 RepID=UPI000977A065|nr:ABC transporter substrate-binding protein [Motiliproteus sp. MSK22-1]OMH25812.1 iron ABC transporter substrate-binding protein [Motiliproteus sp. MSK22-1]
MKLLKLLTAVTLGASLTLGTQNALAFPVTVKSCDREVTFNSAPQRAVSNDVNLTEMMLALGLQDHMAGFTGITGWNKITPELREGLGDLKQLSAKYPSKEVLLGADADFYFAGWNYGMRVGGEVTPQSLDPFGIQVYELTESCIHIMDKPKISMDDLYNDLRNLGKIFGVEERAEALIDSYQVGLAQITAKTARQNPQRVFVYDSGEDRPFTAAKYAMLSAMIEAAGGSNIMDDVNGSWTRVGWEAVVERNPEIIVIVNYGEVTAEQKRDFMMNNPAFKDISAIKHNRFVVLEYDEATPGPRNLKAVQKLASSFYPGNL